MYSQKLKQKKVKKKVWKKVWLYKKKFINLRAETKERAADVAQLVRAADL